MCQRIDIPADLPVRQSYKTVRAKHIVIPFNGISTSGSDTRIAIYLSVSRDDNDKYDRYKINTAATGAKFLSHTSSLLPLNYFKVSGWLTADFK